MDDWLDRLSKELVELPANTHLCDGQSDLTYVGELDGQWVLVVNAGECQIPIKCCPWCGTTRAATEIRRRAGFNPLTERP